MSQNTPPHQSAILPVIVVAILVLASLWFTYAYLNGQARDASRGAGISAPPATILPEARVLGGFQLQTTTNQAFTVDSLKGKWSLVFFGYTHCPDVCPNTMAIFNIVYNNLQRINELDGVQFIFVSVDPGRDTVAVMADYLHYFNKDFIGVTGKGEEIMKLSRQMGVLYIKGEEASDRQNYVVEHSSAIMLIDPSGGWRGVYSAPHNAEAIGKSFLKIRQYYGAGNE